MKMSELIAEVGDDNVELQNLDHCSTAMNYSAKSGTRITFGTEQRMGLDGTEKLGLILWLPRNVVKAAIEKEKAANTLTLKQERNGE